MDLFYYFKSQFIWYYRNLTRENIAICAAIVVCFYLSYLLVYRIAVRKRESAGYQNMRAMSLGLLLGYLYLVFHYTIFIRGTYDEPHYELEVFWSYRLAMQGAKGILVEIILNILLLLPEGMFLPVLFPKIKRGWRFLLCALIGLLTTSCIELSQLIFRRGLFEFDDIINNFIGVLIGYLIYVILRLIFGRRPSKK